MFPTKIVAGICALTIMGPAVAQDLQPIPRERRSVSAMYDADKLVLRSGMNTLYGPVGLIVVPTAYVTPHGRLLFGMPFGEDKAVNANYGLTPGIDVGVSFMDRKDADNKTFANAKINIVPSNFNWFEIGIGVIDAADAVDQTVYAVASADFATPEVLEKYAAGLRLHAGAGTGLFREKFFGGGEVVLNNKMSIIGEYDGVDGNFGLRYVHDNSFRVQAGIQAKEFFISASYSLRFQ